MSIIKIPVTHYKLHVGQLSAYAGVNLNLSMLLVGMRIQEIGRRKADTLATAIAMSNKLFFISDTLFLCLLSGCMKL